MALLGARALVTAIALSAGSLLVASVQAPAQDNSKVVVYALPADPSGSGGVYVIGTEHPDSVSVVFDAATSEYVFDVARGLTVEGDQCHAESASRARCMSPAPSVTAQLGSGDDLLQANPSPWPITSFRVDGGAGSDNVFVGVGPTTIRGRAGDDNLVEGPFDDELRGGGGADRLVGSAGSDFLAGGTGADLFVAGVGADRIRARDGEADADIHCGVGRLRESVRYDRGLDPKPRGCHLHAARPRS